MARLAEELGMEVTKSAALEIVQFLSLGRHSNWTDPPSLLPRLAKPNLPAARAATVR